MESPLANFDGVARLFPLPNLVMFPETLQPLHIFEARYRAMTADALASDRLIAMVLLRDGWEADYDRSPPIHSVACLGMIEAEQMLEDGRYNLCLRGLARIHIVEELPKCTPYRQARVELLADQVDLGTCELTAVRNRLAELVLHRIPNGLLHRQLSELFHSDLPLGGVCNILSFVSPLPLLVKQQLLEADSVKLRASLLRHHLEKISARCAAKAAAAYPPDFSAN